MKLAFKEGFHPSSYQISRKYTFVLMRGQGYLHFVMSSPRIPPQSFTVASPSSNSTNVNDEQMPSSTKSISTQVQAPQHLIAVREFNKSDEAIIQSLQSFL